MPEATLDGYAPQRYPKQTPNPAVNWPARKAAPAGYFHVSRAKLTYSAWPAWESNMGSPI